MYFASFSHRESFIIFMLNQRAHHVLHLLIQNYIAEGHPVGSKTLAEYPEVGLSPASIRNVLSELEDLGLITAPHISSGRIPTEKGYRYFVNEYIATQPASHKTVGGMPSKNGSDASTPIVQHASMILSELSQFAGIVLTPQYPHVVFRHLEFLRLSVQRVLMIIVTPDGHVCNHLLKTSRDYSQSELQEISQYFSEHNDCQNLKQLSDKVYQELQDISDLMEQAIAKMHAPEILVCGENNLLGVNDLVQNINQLKNLLKTLEQKTELLQLLQAGLEAQGVHVFIGQESGFEAMAHCSMITASYQFNGQTVGSLGVIGPTRMDYELIIPLVQQTAQWVSHALSYEP
jgi:heat-inducible transcriptional repressor